MSVSARPVLTAIAPPRAPSAPVSPQTLAAVAAALVVGWTLYADPVARGRAELILAPVLGALTAPAPAIHIGDVVARRAVMDGQTILYVEGSLRNTTKRPVKSPALRLALIGEDGRPVYTWTAKAAKPRLEAAAVSDFRTRLLAPPAFKEIAVTLAE